MSKEKSDFPIFTGVFLVHPSILEGSPAWGLSKFHITWNYNPGDPTFPSDVLGGDFTKIEHLGIYIDDDIITSHVAISTPNGRVRHQADGETPLHITWSSGDKAPVEAGKSLRNYFNGHDMAGTYTEMKEVYDIGFGELSIIEKTKYENILNAFHPIGMWYRQHSPRKAKN